MDDTLFFKVFNHLRNGTLVEVIGNIVSSDVNTIFNLIYEVLMTLMTIMAIHLLFYLLNISLFDYVTLPLFQLNKLSAKHLFIRIVTLFPFFAIFIYSLFKNLNVFGSIIGIIVLLIYAAFTVQKKYHKIHYFIQYGITILLFLFLAFKWHHNWNGELLFYSLLSIYFFVGFFMEITNWIKYIITLDYQSASIAKNNIHLEKYLENVKTKYHLRNNWLSTLHPINRFNKLHNNEIESIINNCLNTSSIQRKIDRGELIEKRNKKNLFISISLSISMIIIMGVVEFCFDNWLNSDLLLVICMVLLFFRLLTRSTEIVIAFYNDIKDKQPKHSNLNGQDRLVLAITSLLEITILSAFIHYFYDLFINGMNGQTVMSFLNIMMEHFSIQVFNISFDPASNIFSNTIHIIQLITSFCLIILAIASYLGLKTDETEYEVIEKDGRKILKEWIFIHDEKETPSYRVIDDYYLPMQFSSKTKISADEYMKRRKAFNEWKEWEEKNTELQKIWKNI